MAVINPLARRSERFFDLGHEGTLEDSRGFPVCHNPCLICSDEDPTSFRVVIIANDESRVRATFFSSDTGEWSICPWVDLPAKPGRVKFWLLSSKLQASGSLYCVYKNRKHMVTLDTATWEFSVAELPRCLRNRRCCFSVGETRDGAPCIVYAIEFKVGVLLRGADTDGTQRWMPNRVVTLQTELGQILGKQMDNYTELDVVAIRDGFAYLATSGSIPSWFFSLCLETMKLEKLFQRTRDTGVHPYVMTWPSSLVGNRGTFALEDGTGNA